MKTAKLLRTDSIHEISECGQILVKSDEHQSLCEEDEEVWLANERWGQRAGQYNALCDHMQ